MISSGCRSFAMIKQKPIQTPYDLQSISRLNAIGIANKDLTPEGGIDYDEILKGHRFGKTNEPSTFKSFEEEVNKHFPIQPTLPTSRLSKRCGVIGYKMGMTHFYDRWGVLTPCTVIQVDRCQVTQIKTKEKDGVNAIQVGCGDIQHHRMKKPQIGHLLKNNIPPKRHFAEF